MNANGTTAVPVIYLDAGTGRGGASRSLYYLIAALNRTMWRPVVFLHTDNPLVQLYRDIGIEVTTLPEIVRFRPGERKIWISFLVFLFGLRRMTALHKAVLQALGGQTGIIHANHENLAITALLLSRKLARPFICHVRTTLVPSFWARFVYRLIRSRAAYTVFISERNREHFEELAGPVPGNRCSVIFNAYLPIRSHAPSLDIPADPNHKTLRVLTLSSATPNRGIDRQLDVAAVLQRRGIGDIIFIICGGPQHRSLNPAARTGYFEKVKAKAQAMGLEKLVIFTGHVDPPEMALNSCDVLIKLGRENVPWGRDLIEAMTHGLPVVTLGTYQGFVEDGVNGFIDPDFDANRIADHLVLLRNDPAMRKRMGEGGRDKASRLFSPQRCADEMTRVYLEVLTR
jgi:glycosyltransferase involved in cell wall biosynthesis